MGDEPTIEWRLTKLRTITTKIGSGATPRGGKKSYKNSGINLIRSLNVYDFGFDYNGLAYIDDEQAEGLSNVEVQPNDILLNITGASVARCCMVPIKLLPARVNQHVAIVRVNSTVADPYFVLCCINSPQYKHHLLTLAQGGATREALTKDTISNFKILLPLLHTQRKIATILGAYDDLIENNTRRIRILEEMAQALYREWFVNFRFPGHENVGMVELEFGLVPEGWEVSTLDDVCQLITDGSHSSPKSVLDGLPMASVKDMHDYGFSIDKCRKIGVADYQKLVHNNCKPLKDDILIAKDGSYLKHIFVVEKDLDMVILSSIAILRPNGRMRPHLLATYLRDPSVNARMKGYVSGVAVPRIVLKDFRKFAVLVPPEPLQYAWGELAEPMVEHCWCLISKNTNLRRTRDLLLPKLISGEVEVGL